MALPPAPASSDVFSVEIADAINARILAVSEDRIRGFLADPLGEIAVLAGLPVEVVGGGLWRCCVPGRSGGCGRP